MKKKERPEPGSGELFPGQFSDPASSPRPPKSHPFALALLIALTVVAFALVGLNGNKPGMEHAVWASLGTALLLGLMVALPLIDWPGYKSLFSALRWKEQPAGKKFGIGCAFVFLFPLIAIISMFAYLICVGVWTFRDKRPWPPAHKGIKRALSLGLVMLVVTFSCGLFAALPVPKAPVAQSVVVTPTLAPTATPTLKPSPTPTLKPSPTPTPKPSPTPTPSPTPEPTQPPAPTPEPTQPPAPTQPPEPTQPPAPIGVNGNPWGYNFESGSLIYSPPPEFCNYFACINNFYNGNGYVVQCNDGMYSKSGGRPGVCSYHGGAGRTLYAH
ncbi:hypothetical protein EI42_02872 [Thermosporothrix hazakensis]|jgi:hypothetical protein|uniref:Uncharacterized protein n=2 Tax=Thermosporothrix TaxID=768650 RepID=A0A326U6K3_THEHA|nr:hypothetical protein [Thermosporothrix hazakensis]PZW29576.1 hypothetical protein EI42_02872 [Thermosporothrix hazakensis]BBH85862.1 hypothetical protein KTC_06130 [Thermosporothrix sp. COM3]GCE45711.1 hypothetical protein KTH_05800 [Thermosporothrix hazakensis]